MAGKKNKTVHVDLTVTGRVQGVGFRYAAVNQAMHYGIHGFVRNNYDGSVGLELEGTKTAVDLMISWCKQGPGTARIENVLVNTGTVKGYERFEVKY
ncbi:MAG: acylphosphatase [Bacteroidales bacterium]|nr:acylphosphatase [Bacteroidales bacterium]